MINDIKEWLNRGKYLDNEIKELKETAQKAYEEATNTASNISDERVQTSIANNTEKKFIRVVHYSLETINKIEELYDVKMEIQQAIYKLDSSTYRTLLLARYINFKTWEQIAEDMGYEVRQIHRIHGNALVNLKDVISKLTPTPITYKSHQLHLGQWRFWG